MQNVGVSARTRLEQGHACGGMGHEDRHQAIAMGPAKVGNMSRDVDCGGVVPGVDIDFDGVHGWQR
jgi:hypothetical protein